MAILAILILGTGWFVVAYPKKEPAVESFLKLVFTPVVGLVGSVIGFYFRIPRFPLATGDVLIGLENDPQILEMLIRARMYQR